MRETMAEQFGSVPVSKDVLESALGTNGAPGGRIALLERRGELLRLRRNLYLCRPPKESEFCPELIANHLYGPSYVSFETVLAWQGFIPERVYTVRSACLGRSRAFHNETGHYTYTSVNAAYFPIGLTIGRTPEGYGYRVARPEKALCDKLISTPYLRLQSVRALLRYLEEDLRFDLDRLSEWQADIIRACAAATTKKQRELELLYRLIS